MTNRRIYPWDGHIVRNASQKDRGRIMANFVRGRGDYMGMAGELNDGGDITVDVHSYWPNDYGLYCMAGNVNEWVADVYRPLSYDEVDEFSPFRGNEFKTKILDEEIWQKGRWGRDEKKGNKNKKRKAENEIVKERTRKS